MTQAAAEVSPREAEVVAEARQHVGTPATDRRVGRDAVNIAMINHWADALDDRNAAYTDAAQHTRHGGVIAPPALLGSWTMDAQTAGSGTQTEHGITGGPRDQVLRRLEDLGYVAVVATDYEQEYVRQLRPGDRLSEAISIEALSERKDTGLGTGYFVTVRHDYFDQNDELVGVARMRLLKFKPKPRPAAAQDDQHKGETASHRPRPPVNRDNAFFWEGVERGELLIQRCAACGTLRHPPRPMCGRCRSTDWDTLRSSGRGTIYSYAIHHHPPLPGLELPVVVVLVELEEDVRILSDLVDVDPETVAIGQGVQLEIREVEPGFHLPLFVRVPQGSAAAGDRA